MSDITVPSWRAQPERQGPPLRMLGVAGLLLGGVALAGAAVWGVSRMTGPTVVPLIEADSRPLKVRPENPGGLQVQNLDQLVLEPPSVRRAAERSAGASARLDGGAETPALDQLRQQAAPPAPPSALASAALPAPAVAPPVAAPPVTTPAIAAAPIAAPVAAGPRPIAAPSPVVTQVVAPQTAAAPPPAPIAAPVAGTQYQIQLAALASEEGAKAEWERLRRRTPELAAHQPKVTRFEREGQPALYRLRVTGLPDQAAARALCDAVRAKGGTCLHVPG